MKKVLIIITVVSVIILGGFFIPLRSFEAYDCIEPSKVRLHFIKRDSIDKARIKNGAFESKNDLGVCGTTESTKYKLYLL